MFWVNKLKITDAEGFQAAVQPVANGARIRPVRGSRLEGEIKVASLPRIGFLAIDSDPLIAQIDPAHGFYGLTLMLGAPFETREGGRRRTFQRHDAHLLVPDRSPTGMRRRTFAGTGSFDYCPLPCNSSSRWRSELAQ